MHRPRHYAEIIYNAETQERAAALLAAVPGRYQDLTSKHIQGMVDRAVCQIFRITGQHGKEQRRRALQNVPGSQRQAVKALTIQLWQYKRVG